MTQGNKLLRVKKWPNQIVERLDDDKATLKVVTALTLMVSIIAISFGLTLSSTSPTSASWRATLIAFFGLFVVAIGLVIGAGLRMRNTRHKRMLRITQRFEDFKTMISWQHQYVNCLQLMQTQEAYHYSLFNQVRNVSIYGGTFYMTPPSIHSVESEPRRHALRQPNSGSQVDSDAFNDIFAIIRELTTEIEATFELQRNGTRSLPV